MLAEGDLAVGLARDALESFDVPGRLLHIRDFVWRGGDLRLRATRPEASASADVSYELRADWDAPVLARTAVPPALAIARTAVIEGRWVRGRTGYVLRVGIDFAVPSVIYIRAGRVLASIPFVPRSQLQVEAALATDLAAYVEGFLNRCLPVPQARANAAARLAELRLSAAPASDTD